MSPRVGWSATVGAEENGRDTVHTDRERFLNILILFHFSRHHYHFFILSLASFFSSKRNTEFKSFNFGTGRTYIWGLKDVCTEGSLCAPCKEIASRFSEYSKVSLRSSFAEPCRSSTGWQVNTQKATHRHQEETRAFSLLFSFVNDHWWQNSFGSALRSLLLTHLTNNKLHGLDFLLVVLNEG